MSLTVGRHHPKGYVAHARHGENVGDLLAVCGPADEPERAGDAFVGVPALAGGTWPLDRRSRPTVQDPFVDGGLLHEMAWLRAGCAVRE